MSLTLDKIPDEIIIAILSQSILNLNAFGQLIRVSKRIQNLALYVLQQYRLPAIRIKLSIDQEGKNRIISQFHIGKINESNLCITFGSKGKRPRRYYSNRALPMIRSISMTDMYQQGNHVTMATADTFSSFQDFSDDNSSCFSGGKEDTAQRSFESSTGTENMINQKISKKKKGQHMLPVSRKSGCWKFCYDITEKEGHAYHLLPSTVCIQLNQLLVLENVTKSPTKKAWGLNIMKWITNKHKTALTS